MAYLDLSQGFPSPFALQTQAIPVLNRLERLTIHIARNDGIDSLSQGERGNRFTRWLFRADQPNPLADPRLEALRRYAVLLRLYGDAIPAEETRLLFNAGFSAAMLPQIRRLVLEASGAAEGGFAS